MMTLLPIVERELRVAARQRATYWVRLGLAVTAILIAATVLALTFDLPPQQTGRHLFEWLAGILLLYCLVYGRRSTADCLSVEKREGTLGLLFLTDLKGHDVVLGKLVATSVRGFYALLAVFPVLAIPLLLGGITNGEFWRVVLVLMDTFLFSLAIGILGSALTRDLQWAMAANIFLLLLLMAVPAACMFALDYFAPGLRKLPQLLFSCPVYAFYLCDDSRYVLMPNHYWWTVGVLHGLSLLLLLVAGWVAPRSWQDRPSRAQKSRWRDLWHAWMRGPAPERAAFRKRTLDTNAFYWLAARARFRTVHVWTFLGCMAIWWLVCWALLGRYWLDPSVAVLTGLLLNFAFKVWVTIEAGRQLAEDKRTGALELLLSLPLTTQDILRGQLLAIRRQFLWPLVVALGVGVLLMLMVRQRAPGWENQATWPGGMAMFVVDLIALAWVGMWRALVARSHNRATISTLLDVLILPWALFAGVAGTGQVWFGLALGQELGPWLAVLPAALDGFGAGRGSGLRSSRLVATAHPVPGTRFASLQPGALQAVTSAQPRADGGCRDRGRADIPVRSNARTLPHPRDACRPQPSPAQECSRASQVGAGLLSGLGPRWSRFHGLPPTLPLDARYHCLAYPKQRPGSSLRRTGWRAPDPARWFDLALGHCARRRLSRSDGPSTGGNQSGLDCRCGRVP